MKRGRWERMDANTLANVFDKLSVRDMVFGVSFVCRSWQLASLQALFSKTPSVLDLRPLDSLTEERERSRFMYLLKMVVDQDPQPTRRTALLFADQVSIPDAAILHLARRFPFIRHVSLPLLEFHSCSPFLEALDNWKELEIFQAMLVNEDFMEVIKKLAKVGNKITELLIKGTFRKVEALTITICFPELKILDFCASTVSNDALCFILDSYENLVELNVLHCLIMEDNDIVKAHMEPDFTKTLNEDVVLKASKLSKFCYCQMKSLHPTPCCKFYRDVSPNHPNEVLF